MKKVKVSLASWRGFWIGAAGEHGVLLATTPPYRGKEKVMAHLERSLQRLLGVQVALEVDVETQLALKVVELLEGEAELPRFSLEHVSPFMERVCTATLVIPRGKVTSYGEIAKKIGSPRALRAVGRALAANPLPIVIPCHRVVRSDLSLGGYTGGVELKRLLLEVEGVPVIGEKVREDCFLALSS